MKDKDNDKKKAPDQPKPESKAVPKPEPTAEPEHGIDPKEVMEAVKKIGTAIATNPSPEAVAQAAEQVCEFADEFSSLGGVQKEKLALEVWGRLTAFIEPRLLGAIYTEIDEDDGGILDVVTDPIAKMAAKATIPPLLKAIGPGLVRLICRATSGKTKVNRR